MMILDWIFRRKPEPADIGRYQIYRCGNPYRNDVTPYLGYLYTSTGKYLHRDCKGMELAIL